MDLLKVSDSLQLPLDFITERATIFGTSGSGKTYFAMKLVEEICKHKLPCVIIDVVGIWWGLRLSVDGTGEGLPLLIAGETDRCDLRVSSTKGKMLAQVYLDTRQNMILDVSGWPLAEQCLFITDFLNELFVIHDRTPLLLVADEAHTYAPQTTGGVAEVKKSLDALTNWATKGRAKGLGLLNLTQRPALLSNSVWGLSSTLITMCIPFETDLEKVARWMSDKTSSQEEATATTSAIRQLKPREAFVASRLIDPARSAYRFVLTQAGQRTTYDSSSTPKVGFSRINPKPLSADLISELETIVDTGEDDDLTGQLRKRIAYLQRQLRSADTEKAARLSPEIVNAAIEGIAQSVEQLQQLASVLSGGLVVEPKASEPLDPSMSIEPEIIYSQEESLLLAAVAQLQGEELSDIKSVSLVAAIDSKKASKILERLEANGVASISEETWSTSERVDLVIDRQKAIEFWRGQVGKNAQSIFDYMLANAQSVLKESELARACGMRAGPLFRSGLDKLQNIGFLLRIGGTYYMNPALVRVS
jgi:hypothetical protein